MANVLTALAPVLYSAARIVPRELTGFLGGVAQDFTDQGVAKGDSVKVPVVPVLSVSNFTPSATFASGVDRTPASRTLTLSQVAEASWNLTAEEERSLMNGGNAKDVFNQTVQQGLRAIVNQIEAYVGALVQTKASRAYGTAGTAPFGSTIADLAQVIKILRDNGTPNSDLLAVINTAAEVNLRSLTNLFKVSEAGSDNLLTNGVLTKLYGADIRTSAGVKSFTKGTGSAYTTTAAGFAIGTTSIPIITGSGTVLAGDVVTFAGDSNKYIVDTGVAAPGTIVLQEPGLLQAIPASTTAMTIGNSYAANAVMHKSAAKIVVRPALQPDGAIAEQMVITDPVTKFSFLMLRVPQNAQASWFIRVVYDAFAVNNYAIATLLG